MIGWWATKSLTISFGTLYPMYESYKAVKSPQKDDDTQWLVYWCVFSLFSVLEFFLDILVPWIPLYQELKLLFVIWLALPYTRGSLLVWEKARPTLEALEGKFKDKLKTIQTQHNTAAPPAAEKKPAAEDKKDE
ncbi:TB2/DP1, HVA22 family-domain-containing protein [Baffinella frigidus]|nr:TB2/DP1, HVA22 family-domain-containing protein [Cryptophyta sp. CCMP2293]|eukprot:CAMPEP_0180141766 /NCGR_PEP_ID=MMETSP0986-20121125/15131_1 /TAXON_ID=697907 /ORGANISM="non described non described, Strain CCMP2293" /LENGTH=133 /DNA_ID=CAMNT_0022084737 /DNA_START=43 /DNA_END=444 /DNA_ORIENTATION=+